MAESLCFDDGTHSLLQRLHEAWSNNAPASTFAAIRDSLLGQRDHLDTHISTLSAVTKIACARHGFKLDDADARWDDFFALAAAVRSGCEANSRKRKRAYNETNRLRNLALVAALWSPDLVFHYGWNSASQVQMNMLRACATRYPRFFHDFRPRLNAVLLERHRRAIQHRRAKTLNEAPLQPHRDFDLVTLASAVPDGDVENRWVTSEDGQVPVDAAGTLLKDLRPDHYQIYLLRRDRYGLLAARGEECVPSSPPAIEPPLPPPPPPPPPLPPLPPSEPTTNPAGGPLAEAQGASSYEFQAHCNVDITFDPSAPHISAPSPDSEFLQALLEGIRLPDSDATMASSDMSLTSATSATSATDYDAHIDIDFDAALHDEAGCASSAFVGPIIFDDFDPQDASHLVASLDAANPGQATVLSPDSRDLRLGSSPTIGQDALTVEEALHSRYHDLIAAYVQRVASEAEQAGAGDWRKPRAQWLSRCTRWASVYTEPESGLPRGGAPSRAEADVLYLTSDEALRAAQKGDVFRRPVVIKEKFSDSGMHTIHECALLLQGASANAVVDVHNTPAATCVDTLLQCLHTNDVAHGGGLDAITLNLRNITRSHRPLLLMLPRFRLLDSLVERLRGGLRGGDQPPPEPPQVDMTSRTSFNTLSLAGAFSGARLAAMSGVWMRNLDGVKFCTFVPEDATVPEREALAETGAADWSPPDGRQRFVVLEQDDVLLIPPGVRVAYSLHSPTSGVMEGGIFWDNLNLVQMLRSAHWICCAHGLARDEAVAGQLPLLVAELEGLVRHRPDRFRGGRSESDFVRAFGLAVSELAEELRCRGAL